MYEDIPAVLRGCRTAKGRVPGNQVGGNRVEHNIAAVGANVGAAALAVSLVARAAYANSHGLASIQIVNEDVPIAGVTRHQV
jgi:hypothetical protein